VLALAGCLGFMMNPVRTWKISVSLLTLLYAYYCGRYLLYIIANPDRLKLSGMLMTLKGLCCMIAFVEVAMSHAKRRSVNVVLARTALTACAILSIAMSVRTIPYLFHSLSAAFIGSVSLAISVGPPCCLAAATWVGRRTLENCRVGIDEAVPGDEA
jgi:hypothetical protein